MKAALTIWEDRISPVFDVSREALIVEIENSKTVSRERFSIPASGAMEKIHWFVDKEVDALICGAISEALFREFQFYRMTVNGFIAGRVDDIIEALLKGVLDEERFLMPGCRRNRCRKQHRQHKREKI